MRKLLITILAALPFLLAARCTDTEVSVVTQSVINYFSWACDGETFTDTSIDAQQVKCILLLGLRTEGPPADYADTAEFWTREAFRLLCANYALVRTELGWFQIVISTTCAVVAPDGGAQSDARRTLIFTDEK